MKILSNAPTPHNNAVQGDIAETILLPGDPLRAKFIAENFLEDAVCFNTVRNMLGYTGTYKGKRISVMGTGMGIPSMAIYSYELIHFYGVKRLIRIGTCGAAQEKVKVKDVVFAMACSTDSNYMDQFNLPGTLAPICSYELLEKGVQVAREQNMNAHVGNVVCSDVFYNVDETAKLRWRSMGVLAAEMESLALYANAIKADVEALCILTVSDSGITGESLSAKERQDSFTDMMKIALEIA